MASPSRLHSRRPVAGNGKSRPMSMIEGQMLNLNLCPPKDSNGTPSKQNKRRSLLPTFSRKVSGEDRGAIREDEEEAGSGTSSVRDSISIASSIPDEPRKAIEEARPTRDEVDKRAVPPPSKLGRPTSTYGLSGLARAPSVRTQAKEPKKANDARADALAALEGAASEAGPPVPPKNASAYAGLKRATSTRLPQSPAAKGLGRATSVRSSQAPPARTSSLADKRTSTIAEKRTSTIAEKRTSTIAEKRSSVTMSRPPSIDDAAAGAVRPPSVTSPTSPASSTTSAGVRQRRPRPQSQMLPPPRPSFNTYQQHYSPAKSALPKPPLPSGRVAKPTFAEEGAPSFEVQKQQVELLQLSLMHQASFAALREYDASAKRKLGKKQAKLRKEYESIRSEELEQQRLANLTALDAWCPDAALLAEHLQILSKVYSELTGLTEDQASRYSQLVHVFEIWIESAEATLSDTKHSTFIQALPSEWHKAHTSLALRLRALQRDIGILPPAPQREAESESTTSLENLLMTCTALLDGMLKELEMMSKLEREILQREGARIQEGVTALDEVLMSAVKEPWVPAWQSVA